MNQFMNLDNEINNEKEMKSKSDLNELLNKYIKKIDEKEFKFHFNEYNLNVVENSFINRVFISIIYGIGGSSFVFLGYYLYHRFYAFLPLYFLGIHQYFDKKKLILLIPLLSSKETYFIGTVFPFSTKTFASLSQKHLG